MKTHDILPFAIRFQNCLAEKQMHRARRITSRVRIVLQLTKASEGYKWPACTMYRISGLLWHHYCKTSATSMWPCTLPPLRWDNNCLTIFTWRTSKSGWNIPTVRRILVRYGGDWAHSWILEPSLREHILALRELQDFLFKEVLGLKILLWCERPEMFHISLVPILKGSLLCDVSYCTDGIICWQMEVENGIGIPRCLTLPREEDNETCSTSPGLFSIQKTKPPRRTRDYEKRPKCLQWEQYKNAIVVRGTVAKTVVI